MSGDESFLALEKVPVSNLSTLYSLLSTLYWPKANGGGRTRIELFVACVPGVESVLAIIQSIDQTAEHP